MQQPPAPDLAPGGLADHPVLLVDHVQELVARVDAVHLPGGEERYFRKSVRLRPPPGSWCRTALARAMVWREWTSDLVPTRDNAELVRAATAGDRGAFAAIYDRYADRLHDFCWSILRDRDEAADATQDAFVVAAERLGQLRDPERLRPWLYAVARSQACRRARARSRVAPEEEMTEPPDPPAVPSRPPSGRTCASWSGTPPPASPSATAPCSTSTSATASRARSWARPSAEPGHAYVLLKRLRAQVERSSAPSSWPAWAATTAPGSPPS